MPPKNLYTLSLDDPIDLIDPVNDNDGLRGALNSLALPYGITGIGQSTASDNTNAANKDVQLSITEMRKIFPDAEKNGIDLKKITDLLNKNMNAFGLTDVNLVAEFLGQVKEETGGLTSLVENLNYVKSKKDPDPVAQLKKVFPSYFGTNAKIKYNAADYVGQPDKINDLIYHNYYGRGLLQLSTEGNYKGFTEFYQKNYNPNIDFVKNPDLIGGNIDAPDRKISDNTYSDAVTSALWYFKNKVMKGLDMKNATVTDITNRINAGHLHDNLRLQYYKEALNVLTAGAAKPATKATTVNPYPDVEQFKYFTFPSDATYHYNNSLQLHQPLQQKDVLPKGKPQAKKITINANNLQKGLAQLEQVIRQALQDA